MKSLNNKPNLNALPALCLIWLPALGWIPKQSITWRVMVVGLIILAGLTIYVWLSGLQTRPSRAIVYVGIWLTPLLLTSLVYFVRTLEHLRHTLSLSSSSFVLWMIILLILSAYWFALIYRSERKKIRELYERGLLKRYEILDEEKGAFNPVSYYPGLDGSSPEESMRNDHQKWGCLMALPISGITFFLIRSVPGSVGWLLMAMCMYLYIMFSIFGFKTLAVLVHLWLWEREWGKPILTWHER